MQFPLISAHPPYLPHPLLGNRPSQKKGNFALLLTTTSNNHSHLSPKRLLNRLRLKLHCLPLKKTCTAVHYQVQKKMLLNTSPHLHRVFQIHVPPCILVSSVVHYEHVPFCRSEAEAILVYLWSTTVGWTNSELFVEPIYLDFKYQPSKRSEWTPCTSSTTVPLRSSSRVGTIKKKWRTCVLIVQNAVILL